MNFIALGFALPTAFHNPWLHGAALVVLLLCLPRLLGIVYIPHTQVGIIEKIWSGKGSLREGQIIARKGEAGFQAPFLRDGVPLEPVQTLGRTVDSNHFQDALRFLEAQGQRGRQRGILREGVYAINLALFVVITEERVFSGPVKESADRYESWKAQLASMRAFDPVVIGSGSVNH